MMLLLATIGMGQNNCADALSEAQKNYDLGLFQNVIGGLDTCWSTVEKKGFKSKLEAHKLRAYTYIAIDSIDDAQAEVAEIVNMKPDYESDLDAPFIFSIALDETKIRMAEQVTSSVSKKTEKIELAPATIEIITEEEIVMRGYRSLEELFHDISGFNITSTKGEQYTLLYQRGYRSDLGDRTLVLINGVEDNGLFTNEAHITRQYPLSNIERVEVIYGPATTMYGANAFQGVINIVTKSANQMVAKGNTIGVNVHSGIGSWNTQMYDATLAGRFRKASFSLTGRVYTSDEMDLSEYSDFNFLVDNDKENGFRYRNYSNALGFAIADQPDVLTRLAEQDPNNELHVVSGDSVMPTKLAFRRARSFDSAAHASPTYQKMDADGNVRDEPMNLGYSNRTENKYLAGKLNIDKLNIGFQLWQKKEGQGGLVTDRFFGYGTDAEEAQLTSWEIRHLTVYSKYDTRISDKLFVSNFTTFKNFAQYPDIRQTIFNGYVNGIKELPELVSNSPSTWSSEYYFLRSKQFKNELKTALYINSRFDIVSGFDVRFGAIPQNQLSMDVANTPLPAYLNAKLSAPLKGGNMVYSNEFGVYTQGAYQIDKNLKTSIGARLDYNEAREGWGYGIKVNPRVAIVYNPQDFVFKAIYASAFLNPSNFQRFGTSAGRVPNPSLKTEHVQNLDLAARWNLKEGSYIEGIAYRSRYSDAIQSIVNNNGDLQFTATGKLKINGFQFNGRHALENGGLYGNYTYTFTQAQEYDENGVDFEWKAIGDIAAHSFNLGSYVKLLNNGLTLNASLNHVGRRATGKETTVGNNPFSEIKGYTIMDAAIILNGAALLGADQTAYQGLRLQFVVNNIFNTEYFHPGARSADGLILTSRIPQETRYAFIKLQIQW